MAIIYSYPNLPLSELNTFTINGTNANGEIVTSTVSLSNLATYITNTGTGSGTTNTLTLWSDGPSGVLGDSILTQDVGATALTVTGNFIATGTGNFTSQVTIPATPGINTDAASKGYVDTQVAGIPAGLVFKGNWDASSTPGGSPDLTSAIYKVVGNYYVVSTAGAATPNGAGTLPNSWDVGDWCVYIEQGGTDRWEKLDQTFIAGSGATGQAAFFTTANSVGGDNDFFWDNANKRLGIGTTSPSGRLEVDGDVKIGDTTTGAQLIKNGDDFDIVGVDVGGNAFNSLHLKADSLTGLYIEKDTNNIGIGTTSPQAVLEIKKENNGNISENIRLWNPGGSSGTGNKISFGAGSTYAEKASITGFFASGGTGQLAISVNGANALSIDSSQNATFTGNIAISNAGSHGFITNTVGDLTIANYADGKSIYFQSDDGNGGIATYFRLDGSLADGTNVFTKFNDNCWITMGDSGDLLIGHQTTSSKIENYTGPLYIVNKADNQDIIFQSDNGGGSVTPYITLDGTNVRTRIDREMRFMDTIEATFGTGGDLKIYHDSNNSYIDDSGNGNLRVRSNFMTIEKYNNGEIMAAFNDDNAVSLYYDNSKKLETTSTGISVESNIDLQYLNEITGIISTQTELMEFRVGDGIDTSSPKQLKIDMDGVEVTGDVEVTNSSDGLILKSPNGTRYRVTVSNGGTLSVSAV